MMKRTVTYGVLLAGIHFALSQNVTVPATCTPGFFPGTDTALVTIPYTYDQAISIIGSYQNLTWSGSPSGSVTLNGTDNTVGTARTYDIDGAHIIETILSYSKPPSPGPYVEVHNTALFSVPAANVSLYIQFDGTVVSSVCDGKASMFNFTANFCATNATVGAALLHQVHTGDGMTVGKFLGGQNFTSCEALGAGSPTPTSSAPAPPATFTGAADRLRAGYDTSSLVAVLMVVAVAL
jgi:hypothetical protein